jgi:hypothetical protein
MLFKMRIPHRRSCDIHADQHAGPADAVHQQRCCMAVAVDQQLVIDSRLA